MFLGIYDIDEYVAIPAATHRFSSGAAYQPTALTYSIYEEGGTTGLDEDVDMTPASPFDAITGAYLARRQLTAAAGFERDKTYLVAVKATVDSVAAVELHVFQIRQKQTGDAYARLGAPAGASVSADVAAVKAETATIVADTNELQTDLTNGGRLDLLVDAIKAKTDNLPASPAAVGSAMTLTSAYDAAKTAASQTSVNAIPTNPLLTNDARLANLDATISSRSTLTAAQVWANSTRTLSSFGSLIADIAAAVWGSAARTLTAISDSAGVTTLLSRIGAALTITGGKVDVNDKTGFGLTTGERTAIANEVEAQIIDDTDSEKVLQAIVDKIAAANPSLEDLTLAAIASAIRTELATELGRIDAAVSSRLAASGYTAPPTAAQVRSELDANSTKLANLDTTVSSRLATSGYTVPPSAGDIKTALEADGSKLDHLWEMTEDDGGVRRLTTNALEQAPTGGGTAPTVQEIVDGVLDELLSAHADVGSVGAGIAAAGAAGDPMSVLVPGSYAEGTAGYVIGHSTKSGAGSVYWPYTVTEASTGNPIAGVAVVVTTAIDGTGVIASGTTNAFGVVNFNLDPGTYYVWLTKIGYAFDNPDTEVII